MPVLLALAGFVVFLCVFGMRGLMIAGGVGAAVYGLVVWSDYRDMASSRSQDAELAAECKTFLATPGKPGEDVMRFICGPAPVAEARR